AEDGIRDFHVTGVQTCALPILSEPVRCRGKSLISQQQRLVSRLCKQLRPCERRLLKFVRFSLIIRHRRNNSPTFCLTAGVTIKERAGNIVFLTQRGEIRCEFTKERQDGCGKSTYAGRRSCKA